MLFPSFGDSWFFFGFPAQNAFGVFGSEGVVHKSAVMKVPTTNMVNGLFYVVYVLSNSVQQLLYLSTLAPSTIFLTRPSLDDLSVPIVMHFTQALSSLRTHFPMKITRD